MSSWETDLIRLIGTVSGWLMLEGVLKVTIILALIILVVTRLRKSSPSLRHFCLRLAVAAALLLPLLTLLIPSLNVALPGQVAPAWTALQPVAIDSGHSQVVYQVVSLSNLPWQFWVLLIWILGVAAVLCRVAVGWVMTSSILRHSEPAGEMEVMNLCELLASDIGLSDGVRIAYSRKVVTPFVWRVFRPVVILPSVARDWRREELRMVLAHELAHVKRHDSLWYLLGLVLTAIHWYNPLAWSLRRLMVIEAERACDDHVLSGGADAVAYAEHIIDLVRNWRSSLLPAPLGAEIAGNKQLEVRVMNILSERRHSLQVKKSPFALALAAAVILALPLAGLHLYADSQSNLENKTQAEKSLPGPDDFVKVDSMPVMIHVVEATYPDSAKSAGITGKVWVKALIDSTGIVRNVVVSKSSGYDELDDAAVKAVWKCKFKPALLDGKPVAVWIAYQVTFTLDDKDD
jgi:TonB family protein